jgi:hypothetical protein
MRSGELPVPPEFADQDWDSIIKKAEEHLKDAKGVKRKFPSMRDIAYECGLLIDYLGRYSYFSEATHTGHLELETYLKFNREGTFVETFIYGPQDGDWVDVVTLQGGGYLLDCMEISGRIFRIRSTREFDLLFKPICSVVIP